MKLRFQKLTVLFPYHFRFEFIRAQFNDGVEFFLSQLVQGFGEIALFFICFWLLRDKITDKRKRNQMNNSVCFYHRIVLL